jgi:hypothetical protein
MTPTSDAFDTLGPDASEMDRYASFESGDDVVVYDQENENAWLQSDGWVALSEWR